MVYHSQQAGPQHDFTVGLVARMNALAKASFGRLSLDPDLADLVDAPRLDLDGLEAGLRTGDLGGSA